MATKFWIQLYILRWQVHFLALVTIRAAVLSITTFDSTDIEGWAFSFKTKKAAALLRLLFSCPVPGAVAF